MSMIVNPYIFGGAPPAPCDPYRAFRVCKFSFDGTNGDPPANDDGGTDWNSSGVSLVTADKVFGSASAEFTGASFGVRQEGTTKNEDFELVTSADFTVRGWIKPTTVDFLQAIAGKWGSDAAGSEWIFSINASGFLEFYYSNGSTIFTLTSNLSITSGVWTHVAASCIGGTLYLFAGGTRSSSSLAISSGNAVADRYFSIGSIASPIVGAGVWRFAGKMDDLTVYNGVGIYDESFTPPAEATWQDAC